MGVYMKGLGGNIPTLNPGLRILSYRLYPLLPLLVYLPLTMGGHKFADQVFQFIAFDELHPFAHFIVAETGGIIGFDTHDLSFPGVQVQVVGATGFGGMIGQVVEVLPPVGRRIDDIVHARINKAQVVGHSKFGFVP